ncbi:MAG: integrase [Chitinophagaceae bacterium]|nr:MAG: integrase [Chitinophagaceae bacterium]
MEVSRFLNYLRSEKRFSENTISAYAADINQFFVYSKEFFDVEKPVEISHRYIRSWVMSLMEVGITEKTVNRKLSALQSFYKFLQQRNIVSENPVAKVPKPKIVKRLPTFLDKKKSVELFAGLDFKNDFNSQRDRMIIKLLYATGLRVSEMVNLKDSDFDFAQGSLEVLGKGNKLRKIPLGKILSKEIKEYITLRNAELEICSPTFFILNDKGEKTSRQFIYKKISSILKNFPSLGKRGPHIIRHTFATHLLENGADINAIKELLGHSSLASTQVYTHTSIEHLKSIYKKSHPKA